MAGSGRRSDVAVATSVVPSALLPKVLPDPGFISDVEVVVVVVGSVQVISGTGCAVLAWRYDLRGNSQQGGKQTETAANRATWFTGIWHVQTTAVQFHIF